MKASKREYAKPDAVKVARPVWNGGKAEKPYLSLQGKVVEERLQS
jgi:hypothetical protein